MRSGSMVLRHLLIHACTALLVLTSLAGHAAAQKDKAAVGAKYPSMDGSRHNKQHPTWGMAGAPYSRIQVPHAATANASDALTGANRPSPRAISLALLHQPYFKAKGGERSAYLLTALGQLVSHDITRGVSTNGSNGGSAPIPIPPGDPFFSAFRNYELLPGASRKSLPYTRSAFTRATPNGPREQLNEVTAWLDASALYGNSDRVARIIRAGTAGRLLDDGNRLLPYNMDPESGAPRDPSMKNVGERVPLTKLRLSGNINVNQNPLIMSMVTILMREHNRRARLLEDANPLWGDEALFQEARKWVIGHLQRIALDDYLTALGIPLPKFTGYNASLNPAIDSFFSTVAYRYGHSTITDVVLRLDDKWAEDKRGHLPLAFTFYNPDVSLDAGLEPLIRGMLVANQGKVEPRWSLAVAGNFAGHDNVNGTDLAAINIQRGRDHAIPDYNSCRRALGLPAVKTFRDITPDPEIADILEQLYGNVNNIDAYVGGLSEPHDGSSHMGPLFTASLREQFVRLRDADWFYYENGAANGLYNETEIDEIRKTSLKDLLARNTNITDLPDDIWAASASMSCAAGGAAGAAGAGETIGAKELHRTDLFGGTTQLRVQPGQTDGWARVTVMSRDSSGWIGFAVADPDSTSPMIGADMVVGRMVDGKPVVKRYHAIDHLPPVIDPPEAQDARLMLARFEQTGGGGVLEFERPMAGGANAFDRPLPEKGRVRLLVARGPSNTFDSMAGYHGFGNRVIIDRELGLYEGTGTITPTHGRAARRAHGILMAVNFVLVMPLGALAARQLRCHWLRAPRLRASLFYVHIATQVAGVAIATAGFVIATRLFGVKYTDVQYGHGKLGVAILVLVYSQLLVGFLRPTAAAPTVRRQAWDLIHSTLGRAAMLIGIANVALGVTIFSQMFSGDFPVWAGLCAAGLGAISLLQYIFDRQEKYAVLKNDAELTAKLFGNDSTDLGDTDPTAQGGGPSGDGFATGGGGGGAAAVGGKAAPLVPNGGAAEPGSFEFAPAAGAAAAMGAAGAAAAPGYGHGHGDYAAADYAAADGPVPCPKLTASLLKQHHAAAGAGAGGAGESAALRHPGFDAAALRGAGPPEGADMGAGGQYDQWVPAAAAGGGGGAAPQYASPPGPVSGGGFASGGFAPPAAPAGGYVGGSAGLQPTAPGGGGSTGAGMFGAGPAGMGHPHPGGVGGQHSSTGAGLASGPAPGSQQLPGGFIQQQQQQHMAGPRPGDHQQAGGAGAGAGLPPQQGSSQLPMF